MLHRSKAFRTAVAIQNIGCLSCHSSTQLPLTTQSATNKAQKPLLFLQSTVSYEHIQPQDCFCPALMTDVDFIQCYITASCRGCCLKSWLNSPSKGCCVFLLPSPKNSSTESHRAAALANFHGLLSSSLGTWGATPGAKKMSLSLGERVTAPSFVGSGRADFALCYFAHWLLQKCIQIFVRLIENVAKSNCSDLATRN